MKMMVATMQTLNEQQSDQRAGQALQVAAVESLHRVGEAMAEAPKIVHKGEEWKTILPCLKQLIFEKN